MNITVNSKDLQKTLGKVAAVAQEGGIMPILANVEFKVVEHKIVLRCTDLRTTIKMAMLAKADGQQTFSVNANLLLSLLKSLPNEEIILRVGDTSVQVSSSKGAHNIPKMTGEFPDTPKFETTSTFTAKGYMLDTVLSATLPCVSDDDMKPSLTGVLFDLKEEGTTFVGVNGYKLAQYKTKLAGNGEKILVPPAVLSHVKGFSDEDIVVSWNDRSVTFEVGESLVISGVLVDSKPAPYEKVVPTTHDQEIVVEQKELLDTLKRVSLFSNSDTKRVCLQINNGSCMVIGRDDNFGRAADEPLNIISGGQTARELYFNAQYLSDVLKTAGEGKIKISFGSAHPVLVNNPASPGLTGLVMPLNA